MKLSKLISFLAIILIALLAGVNAMAQDMKVILKKHYYAVGQANFESIRSISIDVTEVDGFGKGRRYEMVKKKPNLISHRGVDVGNEFTTAFDGDTAWTWRPPIDSSFRWLNQREENLLFIQAIIGSPLVLGEKDGFYMEIHRSAYHERRAHYVFRLDFPDGLFVDFFVDKKSFLINKMVSYTDNTGEMVDVELIFSNFRNIGNFNFPYKIQRKHGDDPVIDMIFGEIAIGVGAPNDLFRAPERFTQ